MKKRFTKLLSVILCMLMMMTMASVAFAENAVMEGSGTKTDPYVVTDKAGLSALAGAPGDYDGKYIVLGNDITLTATTSLTPIGKEDAPFKGYFDGCGYTLKSFRIANKNNGGVFGYTENAVIQNVTINNVKYICSQNTNVGALVGFAKGTTISGVKTVNCTVQGGAVAGGIAGYAESCTISDCRTGGTVEVNTGANVGGIVGQAVGTDVLRCINSASVNGKSQRNCAGIAGSISGKISHCLNNGSVTLNPTWSQSGGESCGTAGIAGVASGEISFCGNGAAVSSTTDCSGIAASVSDLKVSDCYNAGTLTKGAQYQAVSYAIAPSAATITNCVSEGDLTTAEAYSGWDFVSVWFAPGDYHSYVYPVLQDCSFHTTSETSTSATCTLPGNRSVTCTDNCGFDFTVETEPAMGHDWIVSKVVEANCTYEGEKTYKCSRCQTPKTEKEILPVDPDKHVDEDNDNICDLCQKTLKEEEVKKSFFQRIIDFFKRIFDWIKNLFKKKS